MNIRSYLQSNDLIHKLLLMNPFVVQSVQQHKAALEEILSRPCGTSNGALPTVSKPLDHWPSYDGRIVAKFQNFVQQETAISGKPAEHLIKLSGTLSAPLHLLLHHPTFATKHPLFGEASNLINSCLRILVSGKGLTAADGILFSEASSRREGTVN
jgi:hypothetical protein